MPEPIVFDALPLRQRKFARTKLALLDATLESLRSRSLDEVRVADLCAAADISPASFFNYFPQKADVLVYHVQLWSLEIAWHAERLARKRGGLAAIEEVFALTAREVVRNPEAMAEIIAAQARMQSPPAMADVTDAERLLAFPELDGIELVRIQDLESILTPFIARAIEADELPSRIFRRMVASGLMALFFGMPIVLRRAGPKGLEAAYRRQLKIFWAGLNAEG